MIRQGCTWSFTLSFSTNHLRTGNLSDWYTPRTYLDNFLRVLGASSPCGKSGGPWGLYCQPRIPPQAPWNLAK